MSEAKVDVALGNYSAEPLRKKVGVVGCGLTLSSDATPSVWRAVWIFSPTKCPCKGVLYTTSVAYTLQMLQEF